MTIYVISNKAWPYSVPELFGQPNYGPLWNTHPLVSLYQELPSLYNFTIRKACIRNVFDQSFVYFRSSLLSMTKSFPTK